MNSLHLGADLDHEAGAGLVFSMLCGGLWCIQVRSVIM